MFGNVSCRRLGPLGFRKSPPSGRKKGFANGGGGDDLSKRERGGKRGVRWCRGPFYGQKMALEPSFCKRVIGVAET